VEINVPPRSVHVEFQDCPSPVLYTRDLDTDRPNMKCEFVQETVAKTMGQVPPWHALACCEVGRGLPELVVPELVVFSEGGRLDPVLFFLEPRVPPTAPPTIAPTTINDSTRIMIQVRLPFHRALMEMSVLPRFSSGFAIGLEKIDNTPGFSAVCCMPCPAG